MSGSAPAPASEKRRALWVLLALSLTLNLFFLAGAAWIKIHRPPHPPNPIARMRYVAGELHLDARHRKAFGQYLAMLRARLRLMHTEVRPLIDEAWAELAKPQANAAEVMALFDKAAKKHRKFQEELTKSTLEFLATLSPEQRLKFVELARRGPRAWERSLFHAKKNPPSAAKPKGP